MTHDRLSLLHALEDVIEDQLQRHIDVRAITEAVVRAIPPYDEVVTASGTRPLTGVVGRPRSPEEPKEVGTAAEGLGNSLGGIAGANDRAYRPSGLGQSVVPNEGEWDGVAPLSDLPSASSTSGPGVHEPGHEVIGPNGEPMTLTMEETRRLYGGSALPTDRQVTIWVSRDGRTRGVRFQPAVTMGALPPEVSHLVYQLERAWAEHMAEPSARETVLVSIDRRDYRVTAGEHTGRSIREFRIPAIGEDYDLWFIPIPNNDGDVLVGDEMVLTLRGGEKFFTAPKVINAGSGHDVGVDCGHANQRVIAYDIDTDEYRWLRLKCETCGRIWSREAQRSVGSAGHAELEEAARRLHGKLWGVGWCWHCGYRPGHNEDCPVAALGRVLSGVSQTTSSADARVDT